MLAKTHTVVAPDLPGYGDSRVTGKLQETGSKRRMAKSLHEMMGALGHQRFAVVGHDRGGRVAYRMALDFPNSVNALVSVTVVPTTEIGEGASKSFGMGAWHWFMMAQPAPLPETLMAADPDFLIDVTLGKMAENIELIDPLALEDYRLAFDNPEVRHAMCEDYRAVATVDEADDLADRDCGRKIKVPVQLLWEKDRLYGGGHWIYGRIGQTRSKERVSVAAIYCQKQRLVKCYKNSCHSLRRTYMSQDEDDGELPAQGSADGLLSLRQMEVFHTVMQARSITGASKVLNISQPALSRTIRRIEDILGIALFTRDRNGLVPTSEALEIYGEIDPLIRQLTGVGTQIGRIARGETAVFRVGSTASVARALVPQALRALSVEVPGIELFFDVLPVDQVEEYLLNGRGEAVVTIVSSEHPLISIENVGRVDLVAVIPKSHSLASKSIIRPADFADMDFIAFAEGGAHQTVVDRFLSREKLKVNTRAVARFSDTALALANEAMGIVLVDYVTTLGPLGSNLVVRPIENAPKFSISVLWNRRRSHSANLSKLVEILSRRLSDLPPLD